MCFLAPYEPFVLYFLHGTMRARKDEPCSPLAASIFLAGSMWKEVCRHVCLRSLELMFGSRYLRQKRIVLEIVPRSLAAPIIKPSVTQLLPAEVLGTSAVFRAALISQRPLCLLPPFWFL